MTHWPENMGPELAGTPTYFIEKIWNSFDNDYIDNNFTDWMDDEKYDFNVDAIDMQQKLHTIRKGSRWKVGDKIHFQIWTGKPYRSKVFRFAPIINAKSVQEIKIIAYTENVAASIRVDGKLLGFFHPNSENHHKYPELNYLAINDGFEDVKSFFKWFDKDFEGHIIHWTDLKY